MYIYLQIYHLLIQYLNYNEITQTSCNLYCKDNLNPLLSIFIHTQIYYLLIQYFKLQQNQSNSVHSNLQSRKLHDATKRTRSYFAKNSLKIQCFASVKTSKENYITNWSFRAVAFRNLARLAFPRGGVARLAASKRTELRAAMARYRLQPGGRSRNLLSRAQISAEACTVGTRVYSWQVQAISRGGRL